MAELLGSGGRAVEKSWVARDTSDSPRPKSGDRVPLLGSLNAGPGEDGGLGARARGLGKRLTESGLPVREHWAMLAVLVLLTVGDTVFGAVLFFYYGSVYANCVSPPDLKCAYATRVLKVTPGPFGNTHCRQLMLGRPC